MFKFHQLNRRLAQRRPPVRVDVPQDVVAHLANFSFDPQFGARPIRRQVKICSGSNTLLPSTCRFNVRLKLR